MAFAAGSHSCVLTGICMELTEGGKQAIVSLGSQVQTLSRASLRTEGHRRSCESGQPSSQPSAATLSGGTGSILPAGQGFHRWTPQLHMLQRGCRGRKQPNPFPSVEILSPFILSRKCSGPLLHTRCQAPSVTMGQVLSPSLPPVQSGAAHSRCVFAPASSELKHSEHSAQSLARSEC